MCGIAAVLASDRLPLEPVIERMTEALTHRGPDDRGCELIPGDGVALGMRRLSIVDIEGGHQPMWDRSRRRCIVFNGEIYNAPELRRDLTKRGHSFKTDHSDTEVLLNAFVEWGPAVSERLNGMFAFAVWDKQKHSLFVSRDRAGEKPLYLARFPGGVALASELKAVLESPVSREIDPRALEQYFAYDYILGPRTILAAVKKLLGGESALVTASGWSTFAYWRPPFGQRPPTNGSFTGELDALLDDSVRRRMVADVPVGLFLSGGLDSTTVGYYMRRHSDQVHSFSIGFDNPTFDESSYAELAARALGTEHHLEVFSQARLEELIPRVADVLDEPMGDQSILPTYLLSTFTRRHVKVALGGDGSDELLLGYRAYKLLKLAWTLDRLPEFVRSAIVRAADHAPARLGTKRVRGKDFVRSLAASPATRQLSLLASYSGAARWLFTSDVQSSLAAPADEEAARILTSGLDGRLSPADETVAAYLRGYLQDDILVKVDRASMAASLEVRAPFLDPRLIELALAIPYQARLRGFTGKYVLRQLMRGRIPDAIIDRRKAGFGVPLNRCLRESLAPLVQEYLSPERLRKAGLLDVQAVDGLVDTHLSGRADVGHKLWLLLLFELWREKWLA